MAGPRVCAVVVAHASRTRVAETLRSLAEQTYADIDVVVAAIGELTVPDEHTAPTIVPVREGAGFAEAAMRALSTVDDGSYTYVLFLHDDVSLDPDAVERMESAASTDPAIAAVGAKLMEWYAPDVLQEVGAAIDRFAIRRSSLDAGEVDAGQRDDTSDVLFCSDACLLVRTDALNEVGGLDVKAWPFYEDVDLCWRLRALGARVVVEPSARARHAADLSGGRRLFSSLVLRERAEHGRLRFMRKHYAPLGLAVLLPQLVIAALVRLGAAVVRRELWRVRVIVRAWLQTLREFPGIVAERRRAPKARVEDRELLALAARGAVGDVRGERAEWASRMLESLGRVGTRALTVARQPVTWATTVAVILVIVMVRDVLFGGTFSLGEVRPLPTFGDAIADHFGTVRREGLDPFGPAGPGAIVLGLLRSIVLRPAFAEKIVLLLPVLLAGLAGARWGRSLGFDPTARRWLGTVAAVNPVTLTLLQDGSVGALVTWAVALWVCSQVLSPSPVGEGMQERVRFVARWAFAFAVTVALHPPALLIVLALGGVIVAVRRHDGRSTARLQLLATGTIGAFVLLLPWSAQWLSLRSPLVGRPGWLVHAAGGGLERASLGVGWELLAWLAIAIGAAFFVGLDRTTFALVALAGVFLLAGVTGAFPRETMLAATGVCALLIVSTVARHIIDELPRYQLGLRQTAVFVGVLAFSAAWTYGALDAAVPGARTRDVPVVAGVASEDIGRVLWLAETTGGVRAWSSLSFSDRLGAFPPPGGPEERLVTKAIEAARDARTHRLGGVLALADISHIVALDAASERGLASQADLGPQEEQGRATVYRNDAWRGPAILLSARPASPLSPSGLADVVRDPRRVDVENWPYGPVKLRLSEDDVPPRSSVVYLAAGHRGGIRFEGAQGRVAAAGAYVPASDVFPGSIDVGLPGRWWHWMLVLQALVVSALLGAWLTAAYMGAPLPEQSDTRPELVSMTLRPSFVVAVPMLIAAAVGIGWSGVSWGVGTPFLSSAWYCPPIGPGFQQSVGIVNPNTTAGEYIVRTSLIAPPVSEGRIPGRARRTIDVESDQGAVIESYGRRLVAGAEVVRLGDRDASLCAADTRRNNVFPEGGRAATKAVPRLFERYIVFNPFPDLARASVRFIANDEVISPPALQDVQVRPGSFVVVDPEEQFEPMLDLSTTVRVWQGRAIVARRLRTVEQVAWGLPTDEIRSGVLPRAETQSAATTIIAVNQNEDPVRINIFGAGRQGSLPEEGFDVDPLRRDDFDLSSVVPNARDLVVQVEAEAPVAMESLVAPDDRESVSLLAPLRPERRWVVPIAEERELMVVNPTTRKVRVRITRLGPGRSIRPVTLEANRVGRIELPGDSPFGVLVEAESGVVTVAAVGERGTLPGVPLL